MKSLFRLLCMTMCLMWFGTTALAQKKAEPSIKTIILEKRVISDSEIELIRITNNSSKTVLVDIDGTRKVTIKSGENQTFNDLICRRIIIPPNGKDGGGTIPLWNKQNSAEEWNKLHPIEPEPSVEPEAPKKEVNPVHPITPKPIVKKNIEDKRIISDFIQEIEKNNYWSEKSIKEDSTEIYDHIKNLDNYLKEIEDKKGYISAEQLDSLLKVGQKELKDKTAEVDYIVKDFLAKYDNKEIKKSFSCSCEDSIKTILSERLSIRKEALEELEKTIDTINQDSYSAKFDRNLIINTSAIAGVVVILIVWFVIVARRKNKKKKQQIVQPAVHDDASPTIVVRRKTTSILKKQNIDDVIDNKAYMKIATADFCPDSAVRDIYVKNTCIRDIYNMYAEDLRNPDNPKEDGCMVLGRWVHDEQRNEYDVTLEEIVLPGDDAVFQEYELNFGGKIKLRIAEKLRKLRRESNLQYDLTCWVHSHPGLGVFFSNSDSSVQMQLKQPNHPNFLTAFVVDILTPQQELGIFTFKHDSTINSKNELTRLYSLEEMHKWAVESERHSFKSEDYYNVLAKAGAVYEDCQAVQLSNGAIIDICSIVTDNRTGLTGLCQGYLTTVRDKHEYAVTSVGNTDAYTDNDVLGCLVVGTHLSIPSIRKALTTHIKKIKFVLFYSNTQETLTVIPVENMQISMEEKYYNEEKLEDLKIWTRRKR